MHKKTICALLALCSLFACLSCAAADGYVFEGDPTYVYNAGGLHIGIQRVQKDNLVYFLADVQIDTPERLRVALASKLEGNKKGSNTEGVSVIASRNDAILAINADNYTFFRTGLIIRNGVFKRRSACNRHFMAFMPNGDLKMYLDRPSYKELYQMVQDEGIQNTFEFGPVLVLDGQPTEQLNHKYKLLSVRDSTLEPRTAIGQLGELHYLIIVVDGRQEGYSEGMNLRDLQALFVKYGAQCAINLDGGGSTTLYFQGENINDPPGSGERKVADIIYFK